jgi:hypothetical protein
MPWAGYQVRIRPTELLIAASERELLDEIPTRTVMLDAADLRRKAYPTDQLDLTDPGRTGSRPTGRI